MGQLALSVVGAVVGAIIEGVATDGAGIAQGAEIGWAVGGVAGALIFRNQGPQQTDLRVQDSAYGKPIPNVYGLYRCAGNVIWAGDPIEYSGGKGGASNGPSVLISLAIGLCKGPINGIRRIWANGDLIYDVTDPSNFQEVSGSNSMITGFTVYNGDENQLADPTMEASLGVGNVPPFRGLAYVVFNELDLNGWGNYIPSLSFEVITDSPVSYQETGVIPMPTIPGVEALDVVTTQYDPMQGWCFFYGLNTSGAYGTGIILIPARLTNTGICYSAFPTFLGLDWPIQFFTSYDEFGVLTTQGNWIEGVGLQYNIGITTVLGGEGASGLKRNDRFYIATNSPGTPSPIFSALFTLGEVITGNLAGYWALVGCSDQFVYAVGVGSDSYSGWLCQFDIGGNFIVKLAQNADFGDTPCGFLVSDNELYINCPGGPPNFVQVWNGFELEDTAIPACSEATSIYVQNGSAYFQGGSVALGVQVAFLAEVPTYNPSPTPLASVVADMCDKAGLASDQYDVSSLTDTIWGYAITNHSSVRANITPLMANYFFDACDTDSLIKFVRRGGAPVGTFLYSDLGASNEVGDDDNENPITETIAQDIDLPKSLSLSYPALNDDYLVNTQRAFRTATVSNQQLTSKVPVVLGDSEALLRVQAMLWSAWVGRKTFSFNTGLQYIQYEPGDVVNLQGPDGQLYIVRLTDVTYDGQGVLRWQAMLEQPDIYPNGTTTAAGGQAQGFNHQSIGYSGPTILVPLDVPPLRDTDVSQQLYLAACGMAAGWPGVMVQVSRDGNSYANLAQVLNPSVIGISQSVLGNFSGGNQPDELNSVTVLLYGTGTLSSVSYSDFLTGINACYLGGELIYFRTATLVSDGVYTLSGLLRGRVGTEYAMGTHTYLETFVLLDPTKLIADPILKTDIGAPMYFETFLQNQFSNQPPVVDQITPVNACVKPLSPALLSAVQGSVNATTDVTVSWIRRARVNGEWLDGTDVPLDQSTESYQLQVIDGGVVIGTVVVVGTSNTSAYTNGDGGTVIFTASQLAGYGANPGDVLTFSVAQNSNQGVLGTAATTTFTLG